MVHGSQTINEILKASNYHVPQHEWILFEGTKFYLKTIFAYLQSIALSTGYL